MRKFALIPAGTLESHSAGDPRNCNHCKPRITRIREICVIRGSVYRLKAYSVAVDAAPVAITTNCFPERV